jgi:hypothetical protein
MPKSLKPSYARKSTGPRPSYAKKSTGPRKSFNKSSFAGLSSDDELDSNDNGIYLSKLQNNK